MTRSLDGLFSKVGAVACDSPKPGGLAQGAEGSCVCPSCGATQSHSVGQRCNEIKCSKCGAIMRRATAMKKVAQAFNQLRLNLAFSSVMKNLSGHK